jgi:peptidoglycan L-alanyl-D-glutamate endopeptidase CwlK
MNDRSKRNLDTCTEGLQRVFKIVDDKHMPCVITEGYRSPAKQLYMYKHGRSQVEKGKHNTINKDGNPESQAVDAYPEPINWLDTKRMYYFAGVVMTIAKEERVNLRWGGDWDRDTEVSDNIFNDLGHFEEVEGV